MANPWIVEPDDTKIDLVWDDRRGESRKFWIKVKSDLSIGESRRMLKGISNVSTPIQKRGEEPKNAEASFEWTEYSFARCESYLLDWSLADENGDKMPITRDSLEQLHTDLFDLIDNAIDAHESRQEEDTKKKTGKRKRTQTSPS